jgi:hypothetical protein
MYIAGNGIYFLPGVFSRPSHAFFKLHTGIIYGQIANQA